MYISRTHHEWQASMVCPPLQGALLHALGHGERILRNTVGSAIAAVVAATGLVAWPELVPALTLCLSSVELSAVEGGLDALYQVRTQNTPLPNVDARHAGTLLPLLRETYLVLPRHVLDSPRGTAAGL